LRENEDFDQYERGNIELFEQAISTFDAEDIDPLFWAAFSWAGWINVSISDPQAFVDLPKVQIMMQRVLDLDESYFLGAPLLFFGSVWGMKPKMLGGDPEKAKEFFERNLEITGENYLLTYIYYAKYYAVKTLDEELFDQLIMTVEKTPAEVLPQYQLLNMIAKEKAKFLHDRKEDFF
jgi:hypothetical protein